MSFYKNKNIIILGAGLTGLSCVRYFVSLGIYPRIMDSLLKKISDVNLPEGVEYFFGGFNESWLLYSDLIVVSPGISLYHPLLIKAKNKGIEIINDIEIFSREVNTKIVAVTGTNGKTTVVTLLYRICKSFGINVALGGNIGYPVLDIINKNVDLYILELSSFQLECVYSLKTFCSVILNITDDHMDRYPYGFHDYLFSKLNIYNNAYYCIVNNDYVFTYPLNYFEKNIITFGLRRSDYCIKKYNSDLYLNCLGFNLIKLKDIFLNSYFNYINFLAVISICDLLNISRDRVINYIVNFKGLPHRFSVVNNKNGVLWINDSKSTNIGSTLSALYNLSNVNGYIWLLLGGDGKSANFKDLLKPYLLFISNKLRICCYGKSKNTLYEMVPGISKIFFTMHAAVYYISGLVKLGDVILLSPGCSSLDQFFNFKDRGNQFIYLSKIYG